MFNSQCSILNPGIGSQTVPVPGCRVEDRRREIICFRSPLIKPDVRICRIRLSDEFHYNAPRKIALPRSSQNRDTSHLAGDNVDRKPAPDLAKMPVAFDSTLAWQYSFFGSIWIRSGVSGSRQSPHLCSF
jgi:hypothetical protein